MLDFSTVKKTSGSLQFIGYGINDEAEIVRVESNEPEDKSPYISIYFKIPGQDDDKSTRINEYLSEKAAPYTMEKIMEIHTHLCKRSSLESKQFTGVQDLAAELTKMWKGRKLRLKLNAEEYMGVDQEGNPKIKTRVMLPFKFFAEAIMPGAEYAPVKKEESKLQFDKDNPRDYKRLQNEAPAAAPSEDKGDLPF
jgi:hypothetical protein